MTQLPTVAVRERGYALNAGDDMWAQMMLEQVPELIWPFNLRVYERMETDAQISSVLQAVMAPIQRTGWAIDPRGAENAVVRDTAANLGLPIQGDNTRENFGAALRGRERFSWNQHLYEALDFLPKGHSVFEQGYRFDETAGKWRLRKLGFRPQDSIAKFNIADDGGLISIEQRARTSSPTVRRLGTGNVTLPINRLVVYSHARRGANWRGRSVLRACYKNWLLKDDGNRSWAIGVQRNSMGLPVHTAGSADPAEVDKGLAIATRARGGSNAGISVGQGATFELKGVDGLLIDPEKFVRYHDEQIARAVLAHFLNLGTQTGSWALGSTFADFFTLSLQAIAEEIRDIATSHVVEDIVDINFGPTVPAPRLVFDEIGSRAGADDALTQLRAAAGLEDDGDMAAFIREHVPVAA